MAVCNITIIGNLGGDPEMRYTPSGRPVTQLNVAVNQSKPKGDGTWTDETDWFRVAIWGDAAERAAEQLRKGSKIYVQGRFKSRAWHSDKTGKDGYSLEIDAAQWFGLDKRERDDEGSFSGAATSRAPSGASDLSDLDDLPF